MGEYTIEKDPTRDNGLRVLMGPFTVYNKDNVDKEAGPQPAAGAGEVVKATPGQDVPMTLLPKFLGILVFDQANQGAQEAAAELKNPAKLEFLGPTPENSVAGQIEIVTNAATQGAEGRHDLQQRRRPDRAGGRRRPRMPARRSSPGTRRSRPRKARRSSSPRWTSTRPAR